MSDLRPEFWTLPLGDLSHNEWEALCDGCGKCCLNKIEDEDTGEVFFTRVGCRLLDTETCRCGNYMQRLKHVPECIVLTAQNIADVAYFMPQTCAYRLLYEGRPLPHWHPLRTGNPNSVHHAGISLRGLIVSELSVHEDDWEAHLIDEPAGHEDAKSPKDDRSR